MKKWVKILLIALAVLIILILGFYFYSVSQVKFGNEECFSNQNNCLNQCEILYDDNVNLSSCNDACFSLYKGCI